MIEYYYKFICDGDVMEELFRVINLDDKEKIGNLMTEAHSQVKSTKYFPVYMIDGKKMIFKPLSRTKPMTTPFFAYSEVYWSYIINKYFDKTAPRYYLAISSEIEEEQPKYYDRGVLVESLTLNDEELISLYDYFCKYPEDGIDIKDYVNYCMVNYYYTPILYSDFIKNNPLIGEGLSLQILLAELRQDQNYHYENVNLIEERGKLVVAPPIDFEFSTPFMFPDIGLYYDEEGEESQAEQWDYLNGLAVRYVDDGYMKKQKERHGEDYKYLAYPTKANICAILKLYPHVILDFIKKLDILIQDIPNIKINDPDNYIGPLNSRYWKVGYAYFKDNDLEKYEKLKKEIILQEIDKEYAFKRITSNILKDAQYFNLYLKIYWLAYSIGIENLEELTIKELLTKLNIYDDVMIEDIDINTKGLKLRKVDDKQFYYDYYGRKL